MSDVPRNPTAGAAALTGQAPTVLAGGYTVFAPEDGTWGRAFQISNVGLVGYTFTRTLTTDNLILNIKTALGYLPPNVTVVGFAIVSADLDSGSAALVQSLYIGSAVVLTGITTGQAATKVLYACLPTRTTEPTVLYINTTTPAATPVAGAVSVTALYHA